MAKFLSANADLALLISGSCLISAFVIFLIMYLIERRIEVSQIKKLNLYWNLSILLLLIGLYQIFTHLLLKVPNDPQKSLFWFRLSYVAGIPTIPIFLNVVLTLTIGKYKDILDPTSKIKPVWKKRTKLIWWPMWITAAFVWGANFIDLAAPVSTNLLFKPRKVPLVNSTIPYIGEFSDKFSPFFDFGFFPFLWGFALALAFSMILAYIIRVIWYDKIEWQKEIRSKDFKLLRAGLFDKQPTVKWIKTFSLLAIASIAFLIFQGLKGHDWPHSFPVMAYSNFFAFIAIIFILFGEVFSAREETLRAYSNAYISNINSKVNITLSHEMGTPLFIVRDIFRRLSKDFRHYLDDESGVFSKDLCRNYLTELKETEVQVDKLASLATDFKKRAGLFKANLVTASMKTVVSEVLETAKLSTKGKQIEFNMCPDEENDQVFIDPDQMNIILRNLIENAVDAVPARNARVDTSWQIGSNVTIIIKDNGKGIPKRELKKVDKPYYTTKSPGTGTGLGLSIVKNFLQEIKGSLGIDSIPNKGTTVTIKFPNLMNKE
ncbi:MAG: hypothetical protein QG657_2064 [Acidobacteriota bacterium]|nr:hypothetical protein [Acidobacteriota bacterium]